MAGAFGTGRLFRKPEKPSYLFQLLTMATILTEAGESRPTGLSAWAAAGLAVALVVTLLLMATLNVVDRATWHAVDDGIRWEDQPNGVTAAGIADNEATSSDEVQVGDLLRAIDGTPVLDIKPVMSGFQPRGTLREPGWSKDIMETYW